MRWMVREALRDPPPWALPDGRKLRAPSDKAILETLRPLWLHRVGPTGAPGINGAASHPMRNGC